MYEGNEKEGVAHEKVKAQKEKFLKIIDFFGKKGNGNFIMYVVEERVGTLTERFKEIIRQSSEESESEDS